MALLLRFFDSFIPENLRSSPRELMRGYILVGINLTNIALCLPIGLGLFFLLDLEHNLKIGLSLLGTCLIGYILTLVLLRITRNYSLCGNFILAIIATVIMIGIQITGGYLESPILKLTLQIPVMAFLLLGLRQGIAWLVITLLLCLGAYYSAVFNIGTVQLVHDSAVIEAMNINLQFVLVILVGAVLIVYETLSGLLEKKLQAERNKFEHWASHDNLTGAPNRYEFFRRLKAHIAEAGERSQNLGVVYIDLDEFKPVNDTHGHHMGDEALRAVTERLQNILRLSDTTARLGGDEFGLILPGIRIPDDIETIMPKVIEAICKPIQADGVEFSLRASCGLAIFPDHSTDYDELCRHADTAMYRAKAQKAPYLIYEPQMSATDE